MLTATPSFIRIVLQAEACALIEAKGTGAKKKE